MERSVGAVWHSRATRTLRLLARCLYTQSTSADALCGRCSSKPSAASLRTHATAGSSDVCVSPKCRLSSDASLVDAPSGTKKVWSSSSHQKPLPSRPRLQPANGYGNFSRSLRSASSPTR